MLLTFSLSHFLTKTLCLPESCIDHRSNQQYNDDHRPMSVGNFIHGGIYLEGFHISASFFICQADPDDEHGSQEKDPSHLNKEWNFISAIGIEVSRVHPRLMTGDAWKEMIK